MARLALRISGLAPTLVGLAVRALVALVAEDQWGDAPARRELVVRWLAHPGILWDFAHVAQFGPLPTHLAGLLGLGLGDEAGARLLVVLFGTAAIPLAGSLAARFGGPSAGVFAAWALALSPLHIQASTTFASEAIYVTFALGTVLRALAGDPWGMAACAFGASTTRFDTWLWLPLLGAWWIARGPAQTRLKRWSGALLLVAGPGSILFANALSSGDPFRPLAYVSAEHVQLATAAQERWGPWTWRLGMLFFWPGALIAVLTPGFGIALLFSVFRVVRARTQALVPSAFGAFPPALYAVRSIVLGTFWPMVRFAIGPSALLLAAAPTLTRRTLAACVTIAVVSDVALVAASEWVPFVNTISPVSRVDSDVRAAIGAVQRSPLPVVLDVSPHYEELIVSLQAPVDRWNATHPPEELTRARIVTFEGGPLDRELREKGLWRGVSYALAGQAGRVRWWDVMTR